MTARFIVMVVDSDKIGKLYLQLRVMLFQLKCYTVSFEVLIFCCVCRLSELCIMPTS